jgi:hypothetical protein
MHSEPVHGSERFRLICSNRAGWQGQWHLVGERDTCEQFMAAAAFWPRGDRAGVRIIPLSQGKYALVDEADYAELARYRWCVSWNVSGKQGHRKTFYAARSEKGRTIRMHRQIMGAARGEVVDHINHNGLDNRRSNLRVCSQAENMRNRRGWGGRTSRYKGVSYLRRSDTWQAVIVCEGRRYNLGQFDSETDAAGAYNAKARELFGEFACLNVI